MIEQQREEEFKPEKPKENTDIEQLIKARAMIDYISNDLIINGRYRVVDGRSYDKQTELYDSYNVFYTLCKSIMRVVISDNQLDEEQRKKLLQEYLDLSENIAKKEILYNQQKADELNNYCLNLLFNKNNRLLQLLRRPKK